MNAARNLDHLRWPAVRAFALLLIFASATTGRPDDAPLALGGIDPVRLVAGERVFGDESFTSRHQGWSYRFATAENMARFESSPGRFALQAEGHCMVMGHVRARPDLFISHNGYLYGFGSQNCRRSFERDPEAYLLTADERTRLIRQVIDEVEARYVFPEVAEEIGTALRASQVAGEFEDMSGAARFATRLTAQMQQVNGDKHLRLLFDPGAHHRGSDDPEAVRERRLRRYAAVNFGFTRLELLAGNVGYLDLRHFIDPDIAGETASHAMGFLGNCDAIIIDLRENLGGSPNMVAFLASYFFEPTPVHLNSIYWREHDRTDQWWTLAYVPGPRFVEQPLFVLTSQRTFSAAEEFAYDLKVLDRATIVGERSAGGAHPAARVHLSGQFDVQIPNARATNPVTGTNWEATGVEPDVAVSAAAALGTAHRMALEVLIEAEPNPDRRAVLERALRSIKEPG